MRQIILFIIVSMLLASCSASAPQPVTQPTDMPTVPETTAATVPTELPDPIQMLLDSMTVEEKVGQLFLARCPAGNAREDITAYHLGGYILFGQDFENETPDSFCQKIRDYQSVSPIPMLIAVDEEGGTVCRVSSRPAFRGNRFPAPREAYAAGGMEQVLAMETEKAALLRDLGINVNMGPVCDITTGFGAFMFARSLGESPEETGRFVSSTAQIYTNHGIGSVLKHFPGYGNNTDTHTGIATDIRTLDELESADLVPFSAGINAGCDAILVSHTIINCLDDAQPATLSPAVHDYLRNTMGFDGVIVTDDLVMQAITDTYGAEEAAVLAVLAGNDLLCSTEYRIQYPAVLEAVQEGRISVAQLDKSVMRILQWKRELGLIF